MQDMLDLLQNEDVSRAVGRCRRVNIHLEFTREILSPTEQVFQCALCQLDEIYFGRICLEISVDISTRTIEKKSTGR